MLKKSINLYIKLIGDKKMEKNNLSKIGIVDEQELKMLSGAAEVETRSSVPCVSLTVAVGTWVFQTSDKTCPTLACSKAC
ncbi:hypothetical protein COE39_28425 [Bacillus thuringiensis]|nr:hypothetical protein COE39_28425 [Bacillus thuringiensis]